MRIFMQLSYPIEAYRVCVRQAFCELLLDERYAQELPNISRFTKFLTRIKEKDPTLELPELCKTGLPDNWAYIQYNRGPLQIVDEDEFRHLLIQVDTDETRTMFDQTNWGYGKTTLNYWLVANNGSAIEAAEALYYMRLYKVRNITYQYQCINWKSRLIHESLESFDTVEIDQMGTGFIVTWSIDLFVPILRGEVEGFNVQETLTNIFDRSEISITEDCDIRCIPIPARTCAPFENPPAEDSFIEQFASEGDGSGTINVPPVTDPNEV
jgi:hypothetical protein